MLASLTATAQGTVAFNSIGAQVLYAPGYKGGTIVPVGSLTIGLYYSPAITTDPATLILLKTTGIYPVPGRFLGGTVTAPAATGPGAPAVFEIRAWSGPYLSYEAAVASGDDTVDLGRSGMFFNPTGGGHGPPQSLNFANILIRPLGIVPEPFTLGLGLVAAIAVRFLRRRP